MRGPRDSEFWDRAMRAAASRVVEVATRLRKEQTRCAATPDRDENEDGCGCDALVDDLDGALAEFNTAVRRR
jgi:hypothetical protein